MNQSTLIATIFILLGVVVMIGSLLRAKLLFDAVPFVSSKSRPSVLRILQLYRHLMLFIILGYLVVVLGMIRGLWDLSNIIIGMVFFFFAVFSFLCSRLQSTLFKELEQTLQGLLPICAQCKKIRTTKAGDDENWVEVERYISDKTEAQFTHGYCPQCAEKMIQQIHSRKKN